MKVLELSSAHGGMLEIYRHFGHEILGNDHANFLHEGAEERPGHRTEIVTASTGGEAISQEITWPYRKIVESIDLPTTIFDAGKTPYPLEDKNVDYLMTFQAIEHYCHPLAWPALIDEFCRVARRAIIVMLNPLHGHLVNDNEYGIAFEDARKLLARFDRNGFRCTSVHIQWAQALGFKLTAAS